MNDAPNPDARCPEAVVMWHNEVKCTRRPDGHTDHEAGPARAYTRSLSSDEMADEVLRSIGGSSSSPKPPEAQVWITWSTQ